MMARSFLSAVASIVAATAASVCCIVPLAVAVLGIGSMTLAQAFEPYRPFLLILTYALLGAAFYFTNGIPRPACRPGEACDKPRISRWGKVLLWDAVLLVILVTAFPYYAEYLV